MHVCYTADKLLEYVLASGLGQALIRYLLYMMVHAHALAHLHYKMHVCPLVHDFMQFHNIWVPEVRQGVNLIVNC